jgi:hypothetical protein
LKGGGDGEVDDWGVEEVDAAAAGEAMGGEESGEVVEAGEEGDEAC